MMMMAGELSVALTSKVLLVGRLVDADNLRMVGRTVGLLDSGRCCQRDSPATECTVVVGALGAVPARIQSGCRLVGRPEEHTVADEVQQTPRFQDMVARIHPTCPSPTVSNGLHSHR